MPRPSHEARIPTSLLAALLLALAAGCPDDADDSAGDTSSTVATRTATSDATTATSTGSGLACECPEIGVPICDAYVEAACTCFEEKAPDATRAQLIEATQSTCDGWFELAQGPGVDELPATCSAAHASLMVTAAEFCEFEPLAGSCAGYCGSEGKIPEGDGNCYCDAACVDRKDCCTDFYELCGEKVIDPGSPAKEVRPAPADDPDGGPELALSRWPSTALYPARTPSLRAALAGSGGPVEILAGLRDSFAAAKWPSLRAWNRFGAIDLTAGFITLGPEIRPQSGTSLGCLGGFVEAVRLLEAPELRLEEVLVSSPLCEEIAKVDRCEADVHTGLLALLGIQASHLLQWTVDVVRPEAEAALQDTFAPSESPYFVSASHRSRSDGQRRFHHMMVVIADAESPGAGPIVFDVTGIRGVSLRRVPWARLHRYLGPTLADSDRVPYDVNSTQIAVLHR